MSRAPTTSREKEFYALGLTTGETKALQEIRLHLENREDVILLGFIKAKLEELSQQDTCGPLAKKGVRKNATAAQPK